MVVGNLSIVLNANLEPLKKIHPNLEYRLELIKEHGIEDWVERRKCHYWWQAT